MQPQLSFLIRIDPCPGPRLANTDAYLIYRSPMTENNSTNNLLGRMLGGLNDVHHATCTLSC